MIIDFHVHCFNDELAAKAVPQLAKCANIPARLDGTILSLKESMKKAGVDKSVVLSIATKPSQTEKINNWTALIQDDNIIGFGSIHPENENWKEELLRLKENGIKGIKLHPDYQKFFVDDKKMYPIYEVAIELGLIIIFHAGVDIGLPEPYHATPERLRRVIDDFPGGKFVAAHMGGFSYWDEVEKYLVGTEIYFDTSYSVRFMNEQQVRRIINNHGYKKILFATDSPWGDQSEEVQKIREFSFGYEIESAILGLNARELLGI
ncbi:amidohydrolase family protein [Acetivibrio clariflavus]|uniref:amidohydrolase family protein n=1 Tax=Acetivibrio clariflavus TaxID=288965 RepID=UPI000484566B|nr:TatD family hydrolase [Acetivibrio clariflavus]